MEVELSVESKQKSLNHAVAITVVILSVFMGIAKIKDDNLVQAMQLAKADAVDLWAEYQSRSIKKALTENTLQQIEISKVLNPAQAARFAPQEAALRQKIAGYDKAIPDTASRARAKEAEYNALNNHDDQYDISDAAMAIAIACAAVAALVELWLPLLVAWGFGGLGIVFGVAAALGWSLHPAWLVALLS